MTFPLRDYKISSLFIWNVCSFSKSKQTKQFITPICSIFAVNDRFILLLINKSKHMYFSGEKFHINTFCTRFTWYFQGNLFWMHIKCNFEGKSGRERKHLLLTCSDCKEKNSFEENFSNFFWLQMTRYFFFVNIWWTKIEALSMYLFILFTSSEEE